MIGRSTSFLGLAITDRAIACAEVSVAGARRTVRRTATFAIPSDVTLETPAPLGQALGAFLRQNRFNLSRAVVGISARWLIAVEKELPPADEAAAHAALRMQAERLAVSENGELVFEYAGRVEESAPSRVLLVGTQQQRLDRIVQMCDAAGLNVGAVTATGLVLANSLQKLSDDSSIVVLNRGGAEMIWRAGGEPRMLRHVTLTMNGHGTPPIAPLTAELRRAVALARTNGQTAANDLLLLNGVGLPRDEVRELGEKLGVRVRPETGTDALGISRELSPDDSTATESTDQYAPAMALALAAADPTLLPMDFRHSRLAPPQPKRLDRKAIWGIILGTIALLAIVSLYVSVHQRQNELEELNGLIAKSKDTTDSAQAMVDRVRFGRGYFDQRPAVLEGLRLVTLSFRDDEHIWVTSFTLRDNGKGQLIGKAADTKVILALRDRLQKNPRFTDVKLLDMRDADNRSREVTFSISFAFTFVE